MLTRTFHTLELALREDDAQGDGRTLSGIVVPYGEIAEVSDAGGASYRETIRHGAFKKSVAENGSRIFLTARHNESVFPLGRAVNFQEQRNGLYADFRVSRTTAGDDALELVRDGIVDSFSVGFDALRSRQMSNGTVERTEARLLHVGLVPNPAYKSAKVLALRDEEADVPTIAQVRAQLLREGYIKAS